MISMMGTYQFQIWLCALEIGTVQTMKARTNWKQNFELFRHWLAIGWVSQFTKLAVTMLYMLRIIKYQKVENYATFVREIEIIFFWQEISTENIIFFKTRAHFWTLADYGSQ